MASTCSKPKDVTPGVRAFLGEHLALLKKGYSFSGHERSLVMRNKGDGTFFNFSGVSGADTIRDGRGTVFADFDRDGDTDIFLRAMHGPAHLFLRNEVGHSANWIRVRLQGTTSGSDAFGAVVRVKTSAGTLTKLKSGGSGFLSQSDPELLFGLGRDERALSVEVFWPSGKRQTQPGPKAGKSITVFEPN